MGTLPFIALAAAARKREQRFKSSKNNNKGKKNSNQPVYKEPENYIPLELTDIEDEQTRSFIEGYFAYRQKWLETKIEDLKLTISLSKSLSEDYRLEAKKMNDRVDKAAKILLDCMSRTKARDLLAQNPIRRSGIIKSSDLFPSERIMAKLTEEYGQISDFARNYSGLSRFFNIEAVHDVPLKKSRYYEHLNDYKEKFLKEIGKLEEQLVSLQKKLKHTIIISKRRNLKNEIADLNKLIEDEKSKIPYFNDVIAGYCEYYCVVSSLDTKDKKIVADAIADGLSGKRDSLHTKQINVENNLRRMKKEVKEPVLPDLDKLIEEYVQANPQYTEQALLKIREQLEKAEDVKRDEIGKRTHVYSHDPTIIAGELKTADLCRAVYRASWNAKSDNEIEK